MTTLVRRSVMVLLACAACGDDGAPAVDAPLGDPDSGDGDIDAMLVPDAAPVIPTTLAGTGLCLDPGCTQISPTARPYTPRFGLWADTATKRRWIELPAGTTIDTTNMDFWKFPVGTKLWKEFTRDGVRVETRYIVKVSADDDATTAWSYATYQWNLAQSATTEVRMGVTDANGTGHDIPSRANCRECHDSLHPTRVLGFGALQLDFDGSVGELDLDTLIAEGALSTAVPGAAAPHYPLPGRPGGVEQDALGYMHANCGHCHNPTSAVFGHTQVNLRLVTTQLATLAETPAYLTAVNQPGLNYMESGTSYPTIVVPGSPETSALFVRMTSTNTARRMPYRGSEIPDPDGLADLRAWIEALP